MAAREAFGNLQLQHQTAHSRDCRCRSGGSLGLLLSQEYFKNDTLALIGYGSQGHGQGLNLRDNGLNVIIGVRKNGASWKEAQQDGWVPGTNLFDVDEAISKGTIVMNLLSDAAQSETWPAIKPQLTKGKVGDRKSKEQSMRLIWD